MNNIFLSLIIWIVCCILYGSAQNSCGYGKKGRTCIDAGCAWCHAAIRQEDEIFIALPFGYCIPKNEFCDGGIREYEILEELIEESNNIRVVFYRAISEENEITQQDLPAALGDGSEISLWFKERNTCQRCLHLSSNTEWCTFRVGYATASFSLCLETMLLPGNELPQSLGIEVSQLLSVYYHETNQIENCFEDCNLLENCQECYNKGCVWCGLTAKHQSDHTYLIEGGVAFGPCVAMPTSTDDLSRVCDSKRMGNLKRLYEAQLKSDEYDVVALPYSEAHGFGSIMSCDSLNIKGSFPNNDCEVCFGEEVWCCIPTVKGQLPLGVICVESETSCDVVGKTDFDTNFYTTTLEIKVFTPPAKDPSSAGTSVLTLILICVASVTGLFMILLAYLAYKKWWREESFFD